MISWDFSRFFKLSHHSQDFSEFLKVSTFISRFLKNLLKFLNNPQDSSAFIEISQDLLETFSKLRDFEISGFQDFSRLLKFSRDFFKISQNFSKFLNISQDYSTFLDVFRFQDYEICSDFSTLMTIIKIYENFSGFLNIF